MKVRRGFLIAYDAALRKMIPFFVKVRSRDIIPDNPIDITAALTQTSTRWNLDRVEDSVDVTVYKYTANWTSKTDPNAETVGTDVCDGELYYYLYKDGRMEVRGSMRLSVSNVQAMLNNTVSEYRYDIYLPFAFPEYNPRINTSWTYGAAAEASIATVVEKTKITNLLLNPGLSNATLYPSLFKTHMIVATNRTPLTQDYAFSHDAEFGSGSADNYMRNRFPITFTYYGWWKPVPEVEIVNAESYDGVISGAYRTTGMVNLLSKPDSVYGEIIRPLQTGSVVRNYGYYTLRDGVRWFLMNYPATNERGYIPESLLKKGI